MDIKNSENKKFNADVLKGIQIMCRMFWGPDPDSCRDMIEGDFFQPFKIILGKFKKRKSEENPSAILDDINLIINGFQSHQSFFDHLNQCYVRLFVNSKEGIKSPLYQSCYEFENAPMMGISAVKMKNRFLSKGLSLETRVHEPPDHLAIELEYLFFLLQEADGFISNEASSFAGETMLPWVTIFNQRLKSGNEDCRFYFLASGILVLLLEIIAGRE